MTSGKPYGKQRPAKYLAFMGAERPAGDGLHQ